MSISGKKSHTKYGNIFEKTLDAPELTLHLTGQWFDVYKAYHEFDPRVVELYDIQGNTLYMEYIEGEPLEPEMMKHMHEPPYTEKHIREALNQIIDIVNNMFQFTHKYLLPSMMFYHNDIHPGNFVLQKDGTVRLIDPEAFFIVDGLNHLKHGRLLDTLQYFEHHLRHNSVEHRLRQGISITQY